MENRMLCAIALYATFNANTFPSALLVSSSIKQGSRGAGEQGKMRKQYPPHPPIYLCC
ncbi:hypothetical protein JYQ62_04210 [Nostoc sp. UHCC 0702]|nr:hypothetical protein JYQ62_04210 [Nostoc sp. UHCC 0702]